MTVTVDQAENWLAEHVFVPHVLEHCRRSTYRAYRDPKFYRLSLIAAIKWSFPCEVHRPPAATDVIVMLAEGQLDKAICEILSRNGG